MWIIPTPLIYISIKETTKFYAGDITFRVLDVKDSAGTVHIYGNQPSRYSTVTKFIAGSLFYYQHRLYGVEGLESIHADGPTTEAISIVVGKQFHLMINVNCESRLFLMTEGYVTINCNPFIGVFMVVDL